ncbi:MAG TPA: GAF domain-containing protein [Polyangiales bacterium]|nr:GAF domain-containing protein [Polyangiales bacterium]
MSDKKARPTASDRPPEDLKKERDAFIQQFFQKGAQFTEELLKENERIRIQLSDVENDNKRLRAHLASDDAIRELLRKIESLEKEKQLLIYESSRIATEQSSLNLQYADVESELANFANLYVATSQLHQARSVRNVIRNLKELLAQLLGAASFAIYLANEDRTELYAIGSEGALQSEIARRSAIDGPLAKAFQRGELVCDPTRDVSQCSEDDPACVIPLTNDGVVVGVIAVFRTLEQKTEFGRVDRELFKLLGAQAAPALCNARLYTQAGRNMPALEAFLGLEDA